MANTAERIAEYLASGGLFNPESMEHDKVRELLMEISQEFGELQEDRNYWHSQAHLLATDLEAERGKRWCRCGDEASICAICHTLPELYL